MGVSWSVTQVDSPQVANTRGGEGLTERQCCNILALHTKSRIWTQEVTGRAEKAPVITTDRAGQPRSDPPAVPLVSEALRDSACAVHSRPRHHSRREAAPRPRPGWPCPVEVLADPAQIQHQENTQRRVSKQPKLTPKCPGPRGSHRLGWSRQGRRGEGREGGQVTEAGGWPVSVITDGRDAEPGYGQQAGPFSGSVQVGSGHRVHRP